MDEQRALLSQSPGTDWRSRLQQAVSEPFDLAALVSLAVLVPSPYRAGILVSALLATMAAIVVVVPTVRRSWWPWAAFALVHSVTYLMQWHLLDNHDALVAYWAVALALAAGSRDASRTLALQSRLMVGVTFALAAGWKVLSAQFRDGDFFTFALLVDRRFRGVTELIAGVPVEQVQENVEHLIQAAQSWETSSAVQLVGVEAVGWVAVLLTIGTVLVEAVVAVTMLVPQRRAAQVTRSVALAFFLVATYLIVPVSRFGVLLSAMGVAQAAASRRIRLAFALGAVLLFVWGSLWARVIGFS